LPAIRANQGDDAATAAQEQAVRMERYIVSATRIDKNPWRYASIPGFEILSRASEYDTNWWLDVHQRGLWIENEVMPKDWLPQAPVPYTVIIDDTNLVIVPAGQLHLPPIKLQPPADALTWGGVRGLEMWIDSFEAQDSDTFALNSNLHGVDTRTIMYGTISLERLLRCTPPLPRWLIIGLLGKDCGILREAFSPSGENYGENGSLGGDRVLGPGTLWVSLEKTARIVDRLHRVSNEGPLLSSPRMPPTRWDPELEKLIGFPPLNGLFTEAPPSRENLLLWESMAGLFVRWGLMGPGRKDPAMSRGFLELVRRARREPVTEKIFTDCFGFGYGEMRRRLETYLAEVLAKPTTVYVKFPRSFPEGKLKEATADQIGRILGDWLRMQGDSHRRTDPELSAKTLYAAGRMLERAYREDNGFPPDVEPFPGGERSANSSQDAAYGAAVAMKPFVVTATRIHDPRLLAVYGLYEHDIGDDGKAREFLDAAMKAGAARPKAYLVLAELRYGEAIAKPLGSEGKLSAPQAAAIIEPLQTALQNPPVLEVYKLFVETWAHCEAKPAGCDVDRIVEGVALFPRNTALAYRSAFVCAQGGYAVQAAELIGNGLIFTTDRRERKHFEHLRSALPAPTVSSTE
jgi:hypothetical protein